MKRVCGFAVCHISYSLLRRIAVLRTYIRPIVTDRVAWSVGLSVDSSVCQSVTLVRIAKTAKAIELTFGLRTRMGPRKHTYYMGSRSSHGKEQFWAGNWRTIVKYMDTLRSSVQKRLNRSICRLGCGLEWAKGCRSSIVFALMCPRGRMHFRHLTNTTEPSVYGGDAPYVKLLWPLDIFGHVHLDSRSDSLALRAEYYIVGIPQNTAI